MTTRLRSRQRTQKPANNSRSGLQAAPCIKTWGSLAVYFDGERHESRKITGIRVETVRIKTTS